jgi:hypothetical protein
VLELPIEKSAFVYVLCFLFYSLEVDVSEMIVNTIISKGE